MSTSSYSSAGIGIILSPEDLHGVVERKASCLHPKEKGDSFCSRCGLPVVDGWTRADAFAEIREKLIEQYDQFAEINAVEYNDFYNGGHGSRVLIGSVVSAGVGGRSSFESQSKGLLTPASIKQALREILEPLDLWHHQEIQLHVFQITS